VIILTVDQRNSRRTSDRIDALLRHVSDRGTPVVRAFERTAGDEVQGVLSDPAATVDLVLDLVRQGAWSIGIGVGAVDQPLPDSTRAGSGPAFSLAREAVGRAKARPTGLAVTGSAAEPVQRVQASLDLLAAVVARRTERGWEAVDLAAQGHSQVEVAERLGITKQAVSQRLHAAEWYLEPAGRDLAAHLLSEANARLDPS